MKSINYCWAAVHALTEEMERDERVFIAGEDVAKIGGPFGGSRGLLEKFGPKRVKDTPISENTIVGLAVGAAMTGLRPIVEIMYMDFFGLCLEQIYNQAAKMHYLFAGAFKMPIVIRTLCGSEMGSGPHHSQSLEAWVAHVPGLKVVMPTTPYEVKGLLKSAIRDDNPVIFIEHLALYRLKGEVPDEEYTIPIGLAAVKREGKDLTVVATGLMVHKSLKAGETLAQEGIEIEVIDPRTITPLDIDTIVKSVEKTGRLLIVTGSLKPFGTGAEIAAQVVENAFFSLDAPIKRLTPTFTPIPFGKVFEDFLFPQEAAIVETVRGMLK
ncbi:MAG: alpha-ketoacid dehydrogenase subunit beta [Pseudomonadota bacterium]